MQLANLLDTIRKMIDYYERRAGNPSLDFIQRAAAALEVSVAELLGSQPHTQGAKPGPVSQLGTTHRAGEVVAAQKAAAHRRVSRCDHQH